MVISFKKQFVAPILAGTKVHTIRTDKGKRWKVGTLMHMYTGGRFSKEYHEFAKKQCVSIQTIKIIVMKASDLIGDDELGYFIRVLVDGLELNAYDLNHLSLRDGFSTLGDFYSWWIPIALKEPNKRFKGIILHWTAFKY